jgi:hypothetical protein
VLTNGVVTGAITEDSGSLSLSGSVAFLDADFSNIVNAVVVNDSIVWNGGGLSTAQQTNLYAAFSITPATSSSNSGTINWTYAPTETLLYFLAASQILTIKYYNKVTDTFGAVVTTLVTLSVTGTNDVPTITVGSGNSIAASLTETSAALSATGTLLITDVDQTNTVTPSVFSVVKSGITAGIISSDAALKLMLTVSPSPVISNTAITGTLTWSFASGLEKFDYLAEGEILTLVYTVRVTDSNSPATTADQTITITIRVIMIVTAILTVIISPSRL